MHFVTLIYEPLKSSAHRYDIVIGMRAENDYLFGIRLGSLGTIGVVGIGLPTRPTGNGVLKIVEDFNVDIICRTINGKQFAQTIIAVIFIGQFEYGFANFIAQPYDSPANELIVPIATGYQPRIADAGEIGSRRKIDNDFGIGVRLQKRSRHRFAHPSFHHFLNAFRLLFTPCDEGYLTCFHHIRNAHCDGTYRYFVQRAENTYGVATRIAVEHYQSGAGIGIAPRHIESDIPFAA